MGSERHGIKTAAYKQDLQFYLERKTKLSALSVSISISV